MLLVSFWAEMSTDNIPTQIYYKTSDSKNPGVHIHIGRLLIAVFHKGCSKNKKGFFPMKSYIWHTLNHLALAGLLIYIALANDKKLWGFMILS